MSQVLRDLVDATLPKNQRKAKRQRIQERRVVWRDVNVETFVYLCQFFYTGEYRVMGRYIDTSDDSTDEGEDDGDDDEGDGDSNGDGNVDGNVDGNDDKVEVKEKKEGNGSAASATNKEDVTKATLEEEVYLQWIHRHPPSVSPPWRAPFFQDNDKSEGKPFQNGEPMLPHAKVYLLADRLGLTGLCRRSSYYLYTAIIHMVYSGQNEELAEVIRVIYAKTTRGGGRGRDTYDEWLLSRLSCVKED